MAYASAPLPIAVLLEAEAPGVAHEEIADALAYQVSAANRVECHAVATRSLQVEGRSVAVEGVTGVAAGIGQFRRIAVAVAVAAAVAVAVAAAVAVAVAAVVASAAATAAASVVASAAATALLL